MAATGKLTAAASPTSRSLISLAASHRALSLFRIVLYGVVVGEMTALLPIRATVFDSSFAANVALPVCIVAALAAMAGTCTRLATVTVLVALRVLEPHLLASYEVDRIMELFGLLFCLAPASLAWSVDARRRRPRRDSGDLPAPVPPVPPSFVLAVLVVMELVYLDSVITKLHSAVWLDGTASWLAAYLPYVARLRLPIWTQNRLAGAVATYVTIAYEACFLAIVARPLRRVMVVTGLALHLGIAIVTPHGYFGIIMAAPLLLLVPIGPAARAGQTASSEPARSPAQRWYEPALLVYCVLLLVAFADMKAHDDQRGPLEHALGVHPTGVYADAMFRIPAPIVRLEISTSGGMRSVPSFDRDGHPQVRDRFWKVFGFYLRVRDRPVENLTRYVAMYRNRCGLAECRVVVYGMDVTIPSARYDPALVGSMEHRPWSLVGELTWTGADGRFEPVWHEEPGGPGLGPAGQSRAATSSL